MCLLDHTVDGGRCTCAWKIVRPLRGRCGDQWRAWTRGYCGGSDWVVILATSGSGCGEDVLVRVEFCCGGNSFTISFLV